MWQQRRSYQIRAQQGFPGNASIRQRFKEIKGGIEAPRQPQKEILDSHAEGRGSHNGSFSLILAP